MTFNVCLGREFEASGLTFCGGIGTSTHRQFSCQYKHVKGWAVVHLGTKRHGADDITEGERNNLIVVRSFPATTATPPLLLPLRICLCLCRWFCLRIMCRSSADCAYLFRSFEQWCHNWAFRESAAYQMHERRYLKEGGPPDSRCVSATHDRDFAQYAQAERVLALEQRSGGGGGARGGWCPPQGAAHDD